MEHTHHNAAAWFEIPVLDMDRAQAFYEALLAAPMRREAMGPQTLAVFAYDEAGVGGCLLAGPEVPAPSTNGALVYLNATPSLDAALARVAAAGGSIATPKVQLPGDMGVFAHVADSEGNRIGLHALSQHAFAGGLDMNFAHTIACVRCPGGLVELCTAVHA